MTVDDDVLVHENGELIAAKVTAISDIELQGLGQILLLNQVFYYTILLIYGSTTLLCLLYQMLEYQCVY